MASQGSPTQTEGGTPPSTSESPPVIGHKKWNLKKQHRRWARMRYIGQSLSRNGTMSIILPNRKQHQIDALGITILSGHYKHAKWMLKLPWPREIAGILDPRDLIDFAPENAREKMRHVVQKYW